MYSNTYDNVSFLLLLNLILLSFHLYTFCLFYLDDNQDATESLTLKKSDENIRNSKNSIHNTTITHHNDDEISILKENLNTANFSNGLGFVDNNFAAPHYPTQGLMIRFGIRWWFVN